MFLGLSIGKGHNNGRHFSAMKYHRSFFLIFFLSQVLKATNPGMTTILQPANLVGDSISGCIPLTPAVCYANYNYGIHRMISASHPFLRGAKEWKRGTESNANLASVFGIQVKPTDGSNVPYEPVEIHIKDWDIPPYSPHTKAEVLTATIHCLLLSCHASADHPLKIRIIIENKDDRTWAESFEKKYIRLPGKDKKPVTPTPVGDSFIKTDGFGIQYVISRKLNPKHLTPKITPVILPLDYREFTQEGIPPGLVPFWPGTDFSSFPKGPLQCLDLPRGHFYNLFSSGSQFSLELNPLLTGSRYFSIKSNPKEDIVEVRLTFGKQSLGDLTSGIAAAALSSKINHDKPMRITVNNYQENSKELKSLLETPGWKKTSVANRTAATSTFDYDPETQKFAKGTLPGGMVISSYPDGRIHLKSKDQ